MDEAAVYTLKPRGKRKRVFRVTTYYQMAQETKPVLSIELFCTSVFVSNFKIYKHFSVLVHSRCTITESVPLAPMPAAQHSVVTLQFQGRRRAPPLNAPPGPLSGTRAMRPFGRQRAPAPQHTMFTTAKPPAGLEPVARPPLCSSCPLCPGLTTALHSN